jgi:hypothetical protein
MKVRAIVGFENKIIVQTKKAHTLMFPVCAFLGQAVSGHRKISLAH